MESGLALMFGRDLVRGRRAKSHSAYISSHEKKRDIVSFVISKQSLLWPATAQPRHTPVVARSSFFCEGAFDGE
jgi:hypothetical protein